MTRNYLATAMATTLMSTCCAAANAAAWAVVTIGDHSFEQVVSGELDSYKGQSPTRFLGSEGSKKFDWAITLHDDGLAAVRTWDNWDGCTSFFPTSCGPSATGFEQVEVDVFAMGADTRNGSNFFEYSITGGFPSTQYKSLPGQTATYSGTFTVTALQLDFRPELNWVDFGAAVWVDSNNAPSPIPEPGAAAMMMAGLAYCSRGLFRRRRCVPKQSWV